MIARPVLQIHGKVSLVRRANHGVNGFILDAEITKYEERRQFHNPLTDGAIYCAHDPMNFDMNALTPTFVDTLTEVALETVSS